MLHAAPEERTATPILFVNHEVELAGGAEHSLLELLRSLDRARFSPQLACSGDGPLAAAARDLGIPVYAVPMLYRGRIAKGLGLLHATGELHRCLREGGARLLHSNTLIAGYCGLLAARRAGVPSVWHLRDLSYPWLARAAARRASWRIANSAATAAMLGTGPARAATSIIHNGVGEAFFKVADGRVAVRRMLGLPLRERLVAICGRLDPWKGHRVLLDAAARLCRHHRRCDTTFLIIGDVGFDSGRTRLRSYRDELELAAANLGLRQQVRFLGWRDDIAHLLSACDVLVHPSIEPEPFGRAIAEAQAVGVPVIASAIGGIPELVDHGVDGYLVPPSDPEAIAARLHDLLDDHEKCALLASAGREKALRCWTAAAHARAVEAVYDRLLGTAPVVASAHTPVGAGR